MSGKEKLLKQTEGLGRISHPTQQELLLLIADNLERIAEGIETLDANICSMLNQVVHSGGRR